MGWGRSNLPSISGFGTWCCPFGLRLEDRCPYKTHKFEIQGAGQTQTVACQLQKLQTSTSIVP